MTAHPTETDLIDAAAKHAALTSKGTPPNHDGVQALFTDYYLTYSQHTTFRIAWLAYMRARRDALRFGDAAGRAVG